MLVENPGDHGIKCKLCGALNYSLLHEWDVGDYWNQASVPLAVWKCNECSLVMLYPVPTPDQLPDGGDWFSPQKKDLARQYWYKRFVRSVMTRFIGTKSDRFLKGCLKLKKSGNLLDVGCGDGAFLEKASKYYTCSGVDPSPRGVKACREKGFEVFEGFFEDAELPSEHFDMITMDGVIEHVLDPVEVLRICHRILKPGGCVGMITPKIGGPAYTAVGAGWNGFRLGWHTFLFTGKTLKGCIRAAGLEVVRWPQRDRPLDDGLIIWGRKPEK